MNNLFRRSNLKRAISVIVMVLAAAHAEAQFRSVPVQVPRVGPIFTPPRPTPPMPAAHPTPRAPSVRTPKASAPSPAAHLKPAVPGARPARAKPTSPKPATHPAQKIPAPRTMSASPLTSERLVTVHPAARVVETRRFDGTRVVSTGPNRGFVERRIAGRPDLVARTYVAGGYASVRVYREASFHGIGYARYVPVMYFRPAFYAWAFNPWLTPITFRWTWIGAPWYGFFGAYFQPLPIYAAPALWLTDFLLAENLRQAYEDRQTTGEPVALAQATPLAPEMRELIAQEIKRQIETEEEDATRKRRLKEKILDDAPEALTTQRVFVVSQDLQVQLTTGVACSLTPGDIVYRTGNMVDDDSQVGVTILSSKPGSCPANAATTIDLPTLQEMHNDFWYQIDSGLVVLSRNKGKGGFPKGPAAGPRLVTEGEASVDTDAPSALLAQQEAARNEANF